MQRTEKCTMKQLAHLGYLLRLTRMTDKYRRWGEEKETPKFDKVVAYDDAGC